MYSIWFVIFLAVARARLDHYETYHLESFCNSENEEGEINIPAWGAAILKLGHLRKYTYTPAGTQARFNNIGNCIVNVETEDGFSLALIVQDMNIKGNKDRTTDKMDCKGHMKFSTVGKFGDLVNTFTPFKPFKSKTSELCGKTHNAGDNIGDIKLEDISTSDGQGNVFYTKNSNIEVVFYQNQNPYQPVNNSFTLILTTYKRTLLSCEGKYKCPGSEVFCVNEAFECDNHINCAFPNSGGDEDNKVCIVEQQPTLSTATTIIIILACLSGVALSLWYIYVLKSKRKTSTEYPMDNIRPNIHGSRREGTPQAPPMYEAVVAFTADHSDTISNEPTPADPKDVPPSYDQLFPEGPPKQGEEPATTGVSASDLTPPSSTVGSDVDPKIPVIGFENI